MSNTGTTRTPFGIELAAGSVVVVAAAFVGAALFADVPGRLAVVLLAVGGYAATVDSTVAGLAVAGLGYLILNGFVVNRHGELIWEGTTSMWYLVLFVLVAGAGLGPRWLRRARARTTVAAELAALLTDAESRPTTKESHCA